MNMNFNVNLIGCFETEINLYIKPIFYLFWKLINLIESNDSADISVFYFFTSPIKGSNREKIA